jgi:hypothetical protein
LVLIWLNKAVKLLSILINTLWTHRCNAFTKDLPVIKIRVAHLFSVLCSPIMCLYVLGSVLWFPHTSDDWFVFTSSCLLEGSCLINVICVCLRIVVSNAHCVCFLRIVACPFVPLLSFCESVYYLSIFDLRIAITLWYISPVTYVWSSLLVTNKYVVPYFLHSDK